ncbi:MAG: formylmethanofuran--tetrahydromethanopterin N-formyltransferase [Acidiferrobacterales bacterium]|nr:formylmethanofuran--tetrahydromethanopterin N-formyltransferase [Acidiferrobacterales bacterium]
MELNGVTIKDTFAEAFSIKAARLIVTARNEKWVMHAANAATGFATSVVACKLEAGIERSLTACETPDGRPGVSLLFFAVSGGELENQLRDRIGQCILTTPTSAVFSGIDEGETIAIGKAIRYFGDGYQISKKLGNRRYWRIPVMDGEFVCEDTTHRVEAVAGGNFLIVAANIDCAMSAAQSAVAAIAQLPDVITPFPGGVVRSGSKVGSKYTFMTASTNDAYCPTLRGLVESELPAGAQAVLEIVIDGLTYEAVADAMRQGITAACKSNRHQGVIEITCSNFGGKLGKHHFYLSELLS